MTMKKTAVVAALILSYLAVSCAPMDPGQTTAAVDDRFAYGELELLNVTTNATADSITFRGTFRNHFDQPVDGIRVVLRILSDPSPAALELTRAQKVLDTHLEPAAHVAFDISAQANPNSLGNVGLYLNGFAVHRGGEELPIPPIWTK
jgi:hypothetical protein